MVKLPADANVNVGVTTFKVIEVEALSTPDVPVIVTVPCPAGAVLLAVNVTLDVLVVGFVEKVAVTPTGKFVVVSDTLPEKPFCPSTSI